MDWMDAIGKAVDYMEDHMTQDVTVEEIARQVCISPFYFQKGFSLLCGFTVKEYMRNRRLALAGMELARAHAKVIDVALKYGYDSPDSFAKAFARFHGVTPSTAQKNGVPLKSFAPLKITISLEGGYPMDYKIVKKARFTVLGASKCFSYEEAMREVPRFWEAHFAAGGGQHVCGMFGVNIDEKMTGETFEYLIADVYNPIADIPDGFVTREIPAFTWAVFPCKGAMPQAMQQVNKQIYSEWLPSMKEYEIAAGYCIEMYDAPTKYPNGTKDDAYYSELWIPVKEK